MNAYCIAKCRKLPRIFQYYIAVFFYTRYDCAQVVFVETEINFSSATRRCEAPSDCTFEDAGRDLVNDFLQRLVRPDTVQ